MLFTWLPVNLPRPPDKFITQALDIAAKIPDDVIENVALNQDDPEYYTRRIVKNGVEMNSRVQYGFDLGEEWHSWVKTNIIENYDSTGGRLSYGKDTSVHGAHVDSIFSDTYTYKLYYLLDSGGPDTKTNFYQEYGHPILRRGSREHICCCNDYSKLTLIDQLQIPQKHQNSPYI